MSIEPQLDGDADHVKFISAIKEGNLDAIKTLFRSDYIDKTIGNYGETGLHISCKKDIVDIVLYLLNNGCNIESETTIYKHRPIHIAAEFGCVSIVKELIRRKCNLIMRNKFGETPLDAARRFDQKICTDIIKEELKEDEERIKELEFIKLINAIKEGNIDKINEVFISEYTNKSDEQGLKVLNIACQYDNIDIVRYLLDNGCDIECEDDIYNDRSLHYAARCGRVFIINELIDRGCEVDARNKCGQTPEDIALINNHTECWEKLREAMKHSPMDRMIKLAIRNLKNTKETVLGQGAFGKVIRCKDERNEYDFAIKKVTRDENGAKLIKNEIEIFKELDHERIVKYYGTHRDGEVIYIFMECMSEGSILDYLNKHGAMGHRLIARYTKQILEGLTFLHNKNIIHRDIKGANVLRDANDNIKLCDFGTSRYMPNSNLSNNSKNVLTHCGTPYWMAPEVTRGETYSFSADVWSVGATVVEMLTGTHPYPSLNPTQASFKIGNDSKLEYQPTEPLSKPFQSFIDQILVANPMQRATVEKLMLFDFIRDA